MEECVNKNELVEKKEEYYESTPKLKKNISFILVLLNFVMNTVFV